MKNKLFCLIKIFILIFIFANLIGFKCFANDVELNENLKFKQNNINLFYNEILINKNLNKDTNLVLILVPLEYKKTTAQMNEFPAVKSLIKYSKLHHKKVIILVPKYIHDDIHIKLLSNFIKSKKDEYSIKNQDMYITGTELGGIAAYDLINNNPNLFSKAIFVYPNKFNSNYFYNLSDIESYFIYGYDYYSEYQKEYKNNIKNYVYAKKLLNKKSTKYKIINGNSNLYIIKKAFSHDIWNWLFCNKSINNNDNLMKIKQFIYKDDNKDLNYIQIDNNYDLINNNCSLLLILHPGLFKGNNNFSQLANPAVKSIINFIEKYKKNILVIIPQYPNTAGKYSDEINEQIYRLVLKKIKEYNIKNSYITGSSFGGSAAYYFINHDDTVFKKALIVSSSYPTNLKNMDNVKLYFIQGIDDFYPEFYNKFKFKFKYLYNKSHIETIYSAYKNDVWKWLFDIN